MVKSTHPDYQRRLIEKAAPQPENGLVDDATLVIWAKRVLKLRAGAALASMEYEKIKPGIEQETRAAFPEDFAFRKAMANNWALNDLLKKHAWLRDEADSINLAILGQQALRQMLGVKGVK